VCQRRFHHFNLWSERKRIEKLRYMHRNPVKRGLLLEREQWQWSSHRSYAYHEQGRVKINQWPNEVMKIPVAAYQQPQELTAAIPMLAQPQVLATPPSVHVFSCPSIFQLIRYAWSRSHLAAE
jgi:hypothetical protein